MVLFQKKIFFKKRRHFTHWTLTLIGVKSLTNNCVKNQNYWFKNWKLFKISVNKTIFSDDFFRSGGKYGFVDRVIDGIFVQINSVSVKFISRQFNATLQVTIIVILYFWELYSMPSWSYGKSTCIPFAGSDIVSYYSFLLKYTHISVNL